MFNDININDINRWEPFEPRYRWEPLEPLGPRIKPKVVGAFNAGFSDRLIQSRQAKLDLSSRNPVKIKASPKPRMPR